ncbi:MAG: hypothetical protein IJ193_02675 [Bacilli bacterium]|nr:hypothetical protein [Bacilli bacterium]
MIHIDFLNPELFNSVPKVLFGGSIIAIEDIVLLYTGYHLQRAIRSTYRYQNKKDYQKIVFPSEKFELLKKHSIPKEMPHYNELVKFDKVMKKNFTEKQQQNYQRNIRNIYIKDSLSGKIKNGVRTSGQYDIKDNSIYLVKDNPSAIFHELFHMSSSRVEGDYCFSGFSVGHHELFHRYKVGNGLDEGYTELLTKRYFEEELPKEKNYGTYMYEVFAAGKIEKIIGKEKMEELYLNSDINGLLDELEKYTSKEKTRKTIQKLDFVSRYLHERTTFLEKKYVQKAMDYVNEYLIDTYLRKQVSHFIEIGKIEKEKLQDYAEYAAEICSYPFYSSDKIYKPLSIKKAEKITKQYFIDEDQNLTNWKRK